MRVLLVEDEEDIRDLVRRGLTLSESSVDILEAANGMEAIHTIAANPPDAILLDMLMPDMDGWEFLQVLDALEAKIPVIILTAVHKDNASLSGIKTTYPNVIDIMNKPLGIDHIGATLTLLRNAIEMRKGK